MKTFLIISLIIGQIISKDHNDCSEYSTRRYQCKGTRTRSLFYCGKFDSRIYSVSSRTTAEMQVPMNISSSDCDSIIYNRTLKYNGQTYDLGHKEVTVFNMEILVKGEFTEDRGCSGAKFKLHNKMYYNHAMLDTILLKIQQTTCSSSLNVAVADRRKKTESLEAGKTQSNLMKILMQ